MSEEIKLELKNISKSFPGVKALDGVNIALRKGTVHAVMGENGAGKSTLMKIITPTIILTQMGEMNWNNEKGEAFKKTIPSRRFGYPEEVAACAVYLASDASSLFNGANLVIDGGFTIS